MPENRLFSVKNSSKNWVFWAFLVKIDVKCVIFIEKT